MSAFLAGLSEAIKGLAGAGQQAVAAYNQDVAGRNRSEVLRYADARAQQILAEKQANAELEASGIDPASPEGMTYKMSQIAKADPNYMGQTKAFPQATDMFRNAGKDNFVPTTGEGIISFKSQTSPTATRLRPEVQSVLQDTLSRKQIDTTDIDRHERAMAERMAIYNRYADHLKKEDFAGVASELDRISKRRSELMADNRSTRDKQAEIALGIGRMESDQSMQSERIQAEAKLARDRALEARALQREEIKARYALAKMAKDADKGKDINPDVFTKAATSADNAANDLQRYATTVAGYTKNARKPIPPEKLAGLPYLDVKADADGNIYYDNITESIGELKQYSNWARKEFKKRFGTEPEAPAPDPGNKLNRPTPGSLIQPPKPDNSFRQSFVPGTNRNPMMQ